MTRAAPAALLIGLSAPAMAQMAEPTTPPDPPPFAAQGEPNFVNRADIFEFRALDSYDQPEFMDAFVEAGMLPPVEERLPEEPMVYSADNMPDGAGAYGDVMRHVIGGRPEGWNYIAGQSQGWGGIDIGMYECLTRTGPLFMVNPEDLEPLPNLAKSWEWSDDGMQLTVNLVKGAKWSDGDPFDAEDVMFYWDHHVMDPEITPLNGANPETFGQGTTLEMVDDYTVRFTFTTERPEQVLYSMAYGTFCPGPSHILAPEHPANNPDNSYEDYRNAFPPDFLNFPVMGAWVPVEYRADDIVVLRRNPYYWKVDSEGNQLPYLNEMHYRLSTWADRDVQAVAGTGDFSNLEQAENYVESLRRAAEDDSPARLEFGPRIIGYSLYMNLSGNGWGEPDERAQAVRELNRDIDFRIAVSTALDRVRLGESLVKGPFTAQYPGGLYAGTSYYDKDSTVFYPHSIEAAKAHFEAAGLEDTDGDGFYNWPEGSPAGDGNVQITLLANTDYQTDRNLAEGVVAMMEEAGIKVSLNLMAGNDRDATRDSGRYDWRVERNTSELITVVQNTSELASTGPRTNPVHYANDAGELDLLPFEQELADTVTAFMETNDPEERAELMKQYQKLYTENLYGIGLTQYPGALIINKRFANIPSGAPIFMFNWAEDNIIRERVYVPEDQQADHELYPEALPGAPGSDGPVTAG
ncbi:alpha-galactoside ABC transporter periplasmic solute-binding protein precursor [Oceanicola granulosus HTCC2516]|uniref:Alpha-galactoside ABC transporter periplasmic solute-binding protein n=2 Tax=Oceanicola granulosus TaxID=252302 RepID=Q2CK11_OCEGH|nr:alpha-galactoside ABC transporter periplasmic solute-binding protein precursor [Oceanicola granulosus HTCC2516]